MSISCRRKEGTNEIFLDQFESVEMDGTGTVLKQPAAAGIYEIYVYQPKRSEKR